MPIKSTDRSTNLSAVDRKSSEETLSPAKILPLSKIGKGTAAAHNLANKTPSMIDLQLDKEQSKQPQSPTPKPKELSIPPSLTFDDIQKMHYSNLNKAGSHDDEFRPQDFLDLDSGDSDNEILGAFKPENEGGKIISLNKLSSPIKQFVPPYIAT